MIDTVIEDLNNNIAKGLSTTISVICSTWPLCLQCYLSLVIYIGAATMVLNSAFNGLARGMLGGCQLGDAL